MPKFEEIWHRCIDEMLINAKDHSDGDLADCLRRRTTSFMKGHDVIEKRLLSAAQ
ncbi:hypothetical protein O9992_27450 [Vibrio lentus]|nr:hypothetical protein [Vibrio lentus]